jgi:hypothetical protein
MTWMTQFSHEQRFRLDSHSTGDTVMRAEDLLPDPLDQGQFDGTTVRKGTVGAFLINARMLADPGASDEQRRVAEQDIVEALPALRALGLFEILQVRDQHLRILCERH